MRQSRRAVLKTVGSVGAAAAFSVGAAADEKAEGCTETVQTVSRGMFTTNAQPDGQKVSPVVVGGGETKLLWVANPMTVADDAFDETELPGRRINVTMDWNPVGSGPASPNLFFEQVNIAGTREVVVFEESATGPTSSNAVEATITDGTTYDAVTYRGGVNEFQPVSREAVVDAGSTYYFVVQADGGAANVRVEAEVQAFDPECVDDGSE
jgi:hypothetical protein